MVPLLLGLVAALCWSVHDLLARTFAGAVGPYRTSFWVVVTGAALLLGIVLWRGHIWQAEPASIALALLMGVIYAGALAALLTAFSLAPVSIVGPFTAGYPALIVVWGLFQGFVPTPLQWLAVAMVLTGAVIVGRAGPDDGGMAAIAPGKARVVIACSIIAVIGFAIAVVMGQAATHGLGEFETTFVSRFPAAVVLAGLMRREQQAATPLNGRQWLAAVTMGGMDVIAITAINVSVFYPGRELGAMAISSYGAMAVLLAMILLKERVTGGQWLGIFMIVVGVAIIGWPS